MCERQKVFVFAANEAQLEKQLVYFRNIEQSSRESFVAELDVFELVFRGILNDARRINKRLLLDNEFGQQHNCICNQGEIVFLFDLAQDRTHRTCAAIHIKIIYLTNVNLKCINRISQNKPSKILTLLVVHQKNKVLLAMKKRGFGCGKYNGFGGKVGRGGETIYEAAIRECQEEGFITPTDAQLQGYIRMDYDCEPETLKVHIFRATEFTGEVAESEEMKPEWFDVDKIPYTKMWVDDQFWMPMLLANRCFHGYLEFEGHEKLLQTQIEETTREKLLERVAKESEIRLQ